MALLGDTELNDIRGRLLDVEKILRSQDWGPDDSDGYTEAIASLALLRNQCVDLSMFHSDPTPEDEGQRKVGEQTIHLRGEAPEARPTVKEEHDENKNKSSKK